MAKTTEFVARHPVISYMREPGNHLRDKTGDNHGVRVRVRDDKAMCDIGTGEPKTDCRITGHDHALRRKVVLFANHANRYGSIRFERRPEEAVVRLQQ